MKVLERISIKQLIFSDLEEIALPGSVLVDSRNDEWEAPQHPRFQINMKMETLISRSADVSIITKFKILTNNIRLFSIYSGLFA